MKAMLVKKLGMTTVFDKNNHAVATTVFEATPNVIVGIKKEDKDGYTAVCLGYPKPEKKLKKKSKTKIEQFEKIKEFAIDSPEVLKKDDKIKIDIFKEGEKVAASGVSKGKGFAGVIKRHGFSRGPESHGSDHHRAPGSIGSMFPQKVVKGKRMPGRMGGVQVRVKNLEVLKVDRENNFLILKGATPGGTGSIVYITSQ